MTTQVLNQNYEFAAQPKLVKSRSKFRDIGSQGDKGQDIKRNELDNQVSKTTLRSAKSQPLLTKTSDKNSRADLHSQERRNLYEDLDMPVVDEKKIKPYFYIDKPPTPEYKPKERGKDIATQIEDNELLDFIVEVEPVLQVLVGRTLEQSRIELIEEFELEEDIKHKIRYEKLRNAELMVTQRKEAERLRKEAEMQRRQLQHKIQKEQLEQTQMKLISRIISKNKLSRLNESSIKKLTDLGFLRHDFVLKLKRDYIPKLIEKSLKNETKLKDYTYEINNLASDIQHKIKNDHEVIVQKEKNRIKKILDDIQAAKEQKARERFERREKRKRLRIYVAKKQFQDTIQNKVVNTAKEVEDVLMAEICDYNQILPASSIGTFGGLFGEIWLTLTICLKNHEELKNINHLINILTRFLNERLKHEKFDLYLEESAKAIVAEIQKEMNDDLINFNKSKYEILEKFIKNISLMNLKGSNHYIFQNELLDNEILELINLALVHIYFTSIDYKIPEKKPENPNPELQPEVIDPNQNVAEKDPNQGNGEQNGEGGGGGEPEKKEEEFKLPEITPLEQNMVKAKEKLKLSYIKAWHDEMKLDAIARFRIPLEHPEEEQKEFNENPKVITMETIEREAMREDGSIEPFDGSTFERELLKFPEMLIEEQIPCKAPNLSLIKEKIGHINKKGQLLIRKSLLQFIKDALSEVVANMKIEDILKECNEISDEIERKMLNEIKMKHLFKKNKI